MSDVLGIPEITTSQAQAWLAKGPPTQDMTTTRVHVTPELAKSMLERNSKNRPMRMGQVNYFVDVLKRGEFKTTHQGLAFRPDGMVHDGQHRIMAIILSERSAEMLVTWNVPADTMALIDTGAKRTPGDAMALHGYTDSKNVAAVTSVLWRYRTGEWSNRQRSSPDQLLELVESEPEVLDHLPDARRLYMELRVPISCGTVALYLTRRAELPDHIDPEVWIDQIITGEMLRKGMPSYHLRAYFQNRRANKIRMTTKDILGSYARGWHAHVADRKLHNIRWLDSDPVPDIENPHVPRRRRKPE